MLLSQAKGFTLIEVILSIVILSVGIVAVHRVFIGSLSALSVIENRSQAGRLLEQKIWEVGREMRENPKGLAKKKDQAVLHDNGRTYQYEFTVRETTEDGNLIQAKASIAWERMGGHHTIQRDFYLLEPNAYWKK